MPPRPWNDAKFNPKKSKSGTKNVPLVPQNVLSVTSQRLLVVSTICLIQSLKVISSKNWTNFFKYTVLDAICLGVLPILGIPRLNFRIKVVNGQLALAMLVNYLVFIDASLLWIAFWALCKPFGLIFGLQAAEKARNDGLIQGKYIVDILPEASARLDTIAPICIEFPKSVYLRLSLENSWPSEVSLSRAQMGNTDNYERLTYTKRQLAKLPIEQNSMYLPVNEPGAYYLDRVIDDTTGLRVKIWRDRVVVPPCPSVRIALLSDQRVCQDQPLKAVISATGVTPITLSVDDATVVLGEKLHDDPVVEVEHYVEKTGVRGDIVINVDSIEDALGTKPKSLPKLSASAQIIDPPFAKFVGPRSVPKSGDFAELLVEVNGSDNDSPFTIEIMGSSAQLITQVLPKSGHYQIKLDQLGKYQLYSLKGGKCPGYIDDGFVEIFEPPQVNLAADFDVIEDKCAGPTGARARIELEGTGPFKVKYRIWKGSRIMSQETTIFNDRQGTIEFKPRDVGQYRYEIVSVEDQYRQKQFDSLLITQEIKELPGAHFGTISSTVLCGTTKMSVAVMVRGRGPFTLGYSIDDKSRHEVSTEDTADAARVDLHLDLEAGTHFVKLYTLTDRNGCVTDLGGVRTPNIEVNPVIPHITFAHPGLLKSAEPVNIHIDLAGKNLKYPSTIVYEHELSGRIKRYQQILESPSSYILASLPGRYRLVDMNDGVCGGTVDKEDIVEIGLYEKPKLVLKPQMNASSIQTYCLNFPNQKLIADLIGEAPFRVIHEVLDPKGKSHVKQHSISASQLSIDISTDIVGDYSHFFWIMDSRYPEFHRPRFVTAKHKVLPPAEALFKKGHNKLKICENSNSKAALPMTLAGQAPLTVEFQIGNSAPFMVTIDKLPSYVLELGIDKLERGKNNVKILSISDAKGCSIGAAASTESNAIIEVLKPPSPPQLARQDYCVGEKISFSLESQTSKAVVGYHWDNKLRTIELMPKQLFEKVVTHPGEFRVISIKDEQGCKTGINIVAQVHLPPSSTITESPHFSIYKGDQIALGFAFQGTPPFSFIYTRSLNGKVKERKEIKDIMESNYTIIVDEGGEYEIVELQDKFCKSIK